MYLCPAIIQQLHIGACIKPGPNYYLLLQCHESFHQAHDHDWPSAAAAADGDDDDTPAQTSITSSLATSAIRYLLISSLIFARILSDLSCIELLKLICLISCDNVYAIMYLYVYDIKIIDTSQTGCLARQLCWSSAWPASSVSASSRCCSGCVRGSSPPCCSSSCRSPSARSLATRCYISYHT